MKLANMTKEQENQCHTIIHSASVAAALAAAGLAQLPGSDSAVIVPIQITMIISLGSVFGNTIDKSWAKSLLSTYIATYVGRSISQWLFGWFPGIGNAMNAATAAAITEAMGWAIANDFASNTEELQYLED